MTDNFGVSLGAEFDIMLLLKPLLKFSIVLNNTVMDDSNPNKIVREECVNSRKTFRFGRDVGERLYQLHHRG